MRLRIFAFTDRGCRLAKDISDRCMDNGVCEEAGALKVGRDKLYTLTERAWKEGYDLLYIGAAGIAVRAVAPLIVSKLEDRAVLVMDEAGRYVIPILSGHIGGANRLSETIAELAGATAVITTATDIRGIPAVDEWAVGQNMAIMNKDMIARVSGELLDGGRVATVLADTDMVPDHPGFDVILRDKIDRHISDLRYKEADLIIYGGNDRDVISELIRDYSASALILVVRSLILGIGCKRGTGADRITEAVDRVLRDNALDKRLIGAVATIDIKGNEPGILDMCAGCRYRLLTFSAAKLRAIEGDFASSAFVEDTVGVDNVCERAAVAAGGRLIVHKTASEGVTVAVAVR